MKHKGIPADATIIRKRRLFSGFPLYTTDGLNSDSSNPKCVLLTWRKRAVSFLPRYVSLFVILNATSGNVGFHISVAHV